MKFEGQKMKYKWEGNKLLGIKNEFKVGWGKNEDEKINSRVKGLIF